MLVDKSHYADATRQRKRSRLEARISAEEKELFKRAADLQGCSLTEFVVRSAQEAARKTVKEHQIMSLTARDTEAFVKAFLKPPAPSKKIKACSSALQESYGGLSDRKLLLTRSMNARGLFTSNMNSVFFQTGRCACSYR